MWNNKRQNCNNAGFSVVASLIGVMIAGTITTAVSAEVRSLRCEYQEDPLAIESTVPRLGWQIHSDERNTRQVSYHILVASSPEKLAVDNGDFWDSGEVRSDQSVNVPYGGRALHGRDLCYWKVKVVTNHGELPWSKVGTWMTGLIEDSDWSAKWIGLEGEKSSNQNHVQGRLPARYLRKEFVLKKAVGRAMLYLSGLGYYEAFLNGDRQGTQVLSPTLTDYDKAVKYNAFDVTKDLVVGPNAIGVILGSGRYFAPREERTRNFGFPKLLLQLEITYTDGTRERIVSDESWKITDKGPIQANNIYDGEVYDARMEMPGWSRPGYQDASWQPVQTVGKPGGQLQAQQNPNVEIMETINPREIRKLSSGVYILDMGQNMVGWLRVNASGKGGDKIKLRFAETLKPDGSLFTANLRSAAQTDVFILKGEGREVWEPSFTYHGFRYVEVSGFPGEPTLQNFEGRVVYDRMVTTGSFETSNQTLNQVYHNAYWGIRGNYCGMPTDCPQRDERQGWLGDRNINCYGESYVFDNNLLYAKWEDDIAEAQRSDGAIPNVAPNFWPLYNDNVTWPACYLFVADMLYRQYGNLDPIARHYDSMKLWMNYMAGLYLREGLMTKDRYGDWCMPPESLKLIHSKDPKRITDGVLMATAYYYKALKMMAYFAGLLEKNDDRSQFEQQAELVKQAFNAKYFNPEAKQYGNNTVTSNLLPLSFGLVPEASRSEVFQSIADKTLGEYNGHVSTGLVGAQWLMRGLTENGQPGLAYQIATNRTYPSWGYMIEQGATTIWELWNGNTADISMNSGNHVMLLGDLVIWFYEDLAGIKPAQPGFKQLAMKPLLTKQLDYVKASHQSEYGLIGSAWQKRGNDFYWQISIPANTSAIVYLPSTRQSVITEGDNRLTSADGIQVQDFDNGFTPIRIGSGVYHFKVAHYQ